MPKQILLATSNLGKIREIRTLLELDKLRLVAITELNLPKLEVIETGKTFKANALLKARTYSQQSNLPSIAEDSGLAVDALNGQPGVRSARYTVGTDLDRCHKLLKELQGVNSRRAQFITVVCFFDPQLKQPLYFEGQLAGQIALKSAGKSGFGYDSVFIPDGYNKTLAELGLKLKNRISHRYQAFSQLKRYLAENL